MPRVLLDPYAYGLNASLPPEVLPPAPPAVSRRRPTDKTAAEEVTTDE